MAYEPDRDPRFSKLVEIVKVGRASTRHICLSTTAESENRRSP